MIGYKCVYNSIHIKGVGHLKRNKLLAEVHITLKNIYYACPDKESAHAPSGIFLTYGYL